MAIDVLYLSEEFDRCPPQRDNDPFLKANGLLDGNIIVPRKAQNLPPNEALNYTQELFIPCITQGPAEQSEGSRNNLSGYLGTMTV